MQPLNNLHVRAAVPLITPSQIRQDISLSAAAVEVISSGREAIQKVISGEDDRLLVVVGPCSIHDIAAAKEYATWLKQQSAELSDKLLLCMRVYFEKPRTTVGWKGLINDPHLDGTHDLEGGLRLARQLLVDLAAAGILTATELLDPITPQYIADSLCWTAIGARTTESQTHREMASGLSMPVGFKNATDGGLAVATNAMLSAAEAHSFLGIDDQGQASIVRTEGNRDSHVVLRGSDSGTNYDAESVSMAAAALDQAGVCPRVLVDCSHGNSCKDHTRQAAVASDVATQVSNGSRAILGLMLESNLVAGKQPQKPANELTYGQSITDACIDLATTRSILDELATAVAQGRAASNSNVAPTPVEAV